MFEFDIEKYKPDFSVNANGHKALICHKRKKHITPYPEEIIRQAFLRFITIEKGYPIELIEIEKPLTHFEKGVKGRADIVIYDHIENKPLLIIECKDSTQELTDETFEQLCRYNDIVGADYLAFVIGSNVYFYHLFYDEHSEIKSSLRTEMPTYLQLLNGNEFNTVQNIYEYDRPPLNGPFSAELVEHYWDAIGEDTNVKFYPFIFNLIGWLDDFKDIMSFENFVDLGQRNSKFGNAGGGNYGGQYRSFEVASKDRTNIITFGIKSTGKMVDDKRFGNSRGLSYIMVGVENHFSLQLCIDKYVSIEDNKAEIWHDGTITVGKLGQAKRQELLDFIAAKNDSLLKNGKVILGSFDLTNQIKSNQEQTRNFIKQMTEYALIRDQFRNEKKKIIDSKFDAVAYMRKERKRLNEQLSKMTATEIIEYFRQKKYKTP